MSSCIPQHPIAYYQALALRKIRETFPDADDACFSGRYEIAFWNNETAFIDRELSWEYPGRAYPGPMHITEEEFVEILVEDGLKRLEKDLIGGKQC